MMWVTELTDEGKETINRGVESGIIKIATRKERKRYLKFVVCALFGGSVGLFARNFFCALLLLLLFSAHILLSD